MPGRLPSPASSVPLNIRWGAGPEDRRQKGPGEQGFDNNSAVAQPAHSNQEERGPETGS